MTCNGVFFYKIRVVWIADVTLSQVFEISSRLKQKSMLINNQIGIQTSFTVMIFFVLTS